VRTVAHLHRRGGHLRGGCASILPTTYHTVARTESTSPLAHSAGGFIILTLTCLSGFLYFIPMAVLVRQSVILHLALLGWRVDIST
jgi:MFS superfamily sulfate permease-like transporter